MSFCQRRTSSRSSLRVSACTLALIARLLFIVLVSILPDSWSSVSMRSMCARRVRTAPRTWATISAIAIVHALPVRLILGAVVVAADLWPSRAAAAMSRRHRRVLSCNSSRLRAFSRGAVARLCIGLIWILAVRRRSAERPYPLVAHCAMRLRSVFVPKGALVSPRVKYRLRQSLIELLYGLWPQRGAATPCRT